jgi:hypothetical protein
MDPAGSGVGIAPAEIEEMLRTNRDAILALDESGEETLLEPY